MKQQKFFGIILVICVLVTLTGCASATTFDGSRVKNADSYQLDIKTMNCTDTHTLELEQGDTLKIEFETENGNLSMKITAPDGTALYQGDGTVKEFTVEAPMDGAYMDRIERRFTYNGTDSWTDEDGGEWNEVVK